MSNMNATSQPNNRPKPNMTAEQIRETARRKKRVKRIKNSIILIVVLILVGCIASNIFLNIRMTNMQSQIDTLTETTIEDYVKLATDKAKEELKADLEQETSKKNEISEAVDENTSDNAFDYDSDVDISEVYECIDPSNNVSTIDGEHTVYLTFDDGPSINTDNILEVLDNHGVKATFFVTGREEDTQLAKYLDIFNAGHTIGIHSYSHKYSELYNSVDAFAADLDRIVNLVSDITGVEPSIYRFPGGSNANVGAADMDDFIKYLGYKGMRYYDWNISSGDATSQIYSVDELVENVLKDVPKYRYSVVLMHDQSDKTKTVEALEKILDRLEEMNCEILPITDDSPVIHHTNN